MALAVWIGHPFTVRLSCPQAARMPRPRGAAIARVAIQAQSETAYGTVTLNVAVTVALVFTSVAVTV
jgi:hypothetical protein